MKKGLKISLIILAIIIIAALIYFYFNQPKELVEPEDKGVEIGKAVPVKVTIVQKDTLVHYIHTEGKAQAAKSWQAIAEIDGIVEKINFKNGDRVKAGDLILKISNEELETRLIKSSIQYQKNYAEYLSLKEILPTKLKDYGIELKSILNKSKNYDEYEKSLKEIITREKGQKIYDNYITLKEARNSLKQMYAQYKKLNLHAPFSGVIGGLELKTDNYISIGTKLFKLYDPNKMELIAPLMETEISRLIVGDNAYLRFLAFPEEYIKGKIISIDKVISDESQLGKVKVGFSNPKNKISVGMFADCYLFAEKKKDVLLVPNLSILERDNRQLVFTKENNHSYWRYVKTGESNGYFTEIISGIQPGDSVVVERQYTLIHDAKVEVTDVIPVHKFSLTEFKENNK
ncbi:MAG: efflux RND transporter periplasmic adaptor subunit [Candidatus Cloacimonetes bacterium]|nr:efflux RND transporter periplasmic adaptor subunit [Candidatus Cloacimonadota bacterium]MBS3767552.1 efflux RND transporter periplasmic adaptor subunit [Candidatus Cloacimonadota bacterium]